VTDCNSEKVRSTAHKCKYTGPRPIYKRYSTGQQFQCSSGFGGNAGGVQNWTKIRSAVPSIDSYISVTSPYRRIFFFGGGQGAMPPNLIGPNKFQERSSGIFKKDKGSPYSIIERMVPELIPVLGSQPAGDMSHKPGGRLSLISARPAVTLATLKRVATNFAAW